MGLYGLWIGLASGLAFINVFFGFMLFIKFNWTQIAEELRPIVKDEKYIQEEEIEVQLI